MCRDLRFPILLALMAASAAVPAPAQTASVALKTEWAVSDGTLFPSSLDDGMGFSFVLDGQKIGPAAPAGWQVTAETGGTVRLRHSSGFTVLRSVIRHGDFGAIEYSVRFRNEGRAVSPVLESIRAMDLSFVLEDGRPPYLVSSGGGLADSVFPPRTFAIQKHWFAPMTPIGGDVTLTTEGGRSSNRDLPFFFLQDDQRNRGVFVAVGWSGQWSATIAADPDHQRMRVWGGIPDLHLRLDPGEEIPGPNILLGAYRGAIATGSNQLRRLIRERITPRLDGRTFDPPATYDHWWNIAERFDQPLLRRLADAAAAIGQEYFLLDAGWYAGTNGPGGFSAGVGNWEELDGTKFPDGLRPFSDYVRSKGLKFGLWFEPERVARGSLLARQHPDWVLWLPNAAPDRAPFQTSQFGVLDYSRPEVQEWVRNLLDRYISELDIRYIRHDFNIDPLAYWNAHDSSDRRGITQLRHIEGFYKVLDWIRQKHPGTLLEGCASGGRRIDLETARRFHTFWISDHTLDPHIVRFHLEGLNYFLPGNYQYVCYALPLPSQKNFQASDFSFQSFFGGAFGTGGRVDAWSPAMRQQAVKQVQVFKKLRHFLMADYYPLAPQPRDLASWEGWQFHDPAAGAGFVQFFRTGSPEGTRTFRLHGLKADARYRFSDPYSGNSFERTGKQLLQDGITATLAEMSSQVLIYQAMP